MKFTFKLELKPGENPCYVHREDGTEVVIYYGNPPLKQRGIWVSARVPGVAAVFLALLRRLEQFDEAALAAAANDFDLDIHVLR